MLQPKQLKHFRARCCNCACLLPNEAPIIAETIEHMMTATKHVDKLDLHVVYNTPKDMPEEEAALKALVERDWPCGRRLFVKRNYESKSKAANLNCVIPTIEAEYTVIYDADHHPDPDSLAKAITRLKCSSALDCVQGSTYIRQGFFLGRWLVNAEFFIVYFVFMQAQQVITGSGLFAGSNGIWRTKSLQRMKFNTHALCEDIDCTATALVEQGLNFEWMPECASGELLPNGLQAFWKQRIRWSMGWDQVTLKRIGDFAKANCSLRRRLGLCLIFPGRWITQSCMVVVSLYAIALALRGAVLSYLPHLSIPELVQPPPMNVPTSVSMLQLWSGYQGLGFLIMSLARLFISAKLAYLPGLIMYFCVMLGYFVFGVALTAVSLYRNFTGTTGGWVVTTRSGKQGAAQGLATPLLSSTSKRDEGDAASSKKCSKKKTIIQPVIVLIFILGTLCTGVVLGAIVGILNGKEPISSAPDRIKDQILNKAQYYIEGGFVANCTVLGALLSLPIVFAAIILVRRLMRRLISSPSSGTDDLPA